MAFTHQHINAYVIVGGDSDFLSLVEKLKQYDKKVFIVGGRAFTSVILQRNCHEFIAYENLSGVRKAAARAGRPAATTASAPIAQAFPIVRRALKILADREVSPQTGLLKSTLLQLDSTFSERNYGASSFLDFAEKLAQAGLVQLKTAGRSVMVELNPDAGEGEHVSSEAADLKVVTTTDTDVVQVFRPAADAAVRPAEAASRPADAPPQATSSNAEGIQFVGDTLRAATSARWPMYIRNVKQLLRAADSSFDERRYAFGGLMDLLRACQRDGLIRMERDRRGGLRVFPGSALQQSFVPRAVPSPVLPQPDVAFDEPAETGYQPPAVEEIVVQAEVLDADAEPSGPQPIDTTAELLGRAKTRRPRAARAASSSGTRKSTRSAAAAGSRKSASRRSSRSKKSDADTNDNIGNS